MPFEVKSICSLNFILGKQTTVTTDRVLLSIEIDSPYIDLILSQR